MFNSIKCFAKINYETSDIILFGKAVCGKVAISVDKLKQSTKVTPSSDGTTFTAITTSTDAYKFSFFPRTVREWNSLTPHSWLKLFSHTFAKLAITPQRCTIAGYILKNVKN